MRWRTFEERRHAEPHYEEPPRDHGEQRDRVRPDERHSRDRREQRRQGVELFTSNRAEHKRSVPGKQQRGTFDVSARKSLSCARTGT